MSVIGRLDDQVEEVIIAPIARRHERKNRERVNDQARRDEEAKQTTERDQRNDSEMD
jgi:hypothetical protein